MPKSKFDPSLEFDGSMWVLSLFNSNYRSSGIIAGHSILFVEGIQKRDASFYSEIFLGQYHIAATIDKPAVLNSAGYVSAVFIADSDKGGEIGFDTETGKPVPISVMEFKLLYGKTDYASKFTSVSWRLSADNIKKMIQAVKEDRTKTINAHQGKGEFIPYQFLGQYHFNAQGKGVNCATWSEGHIATARGEKPLELLGVTSPSPELYANDSTRNTVGTTATLASVKATPLRAKL